MFATGFDEKSRKSISVPLQRRRLRKGAVPRVFPDCPSYLSDVKTPRESPSVKRKRNEEEFLTKSMELSVLSKEQYDKDRIFSSFEELLLCNAKHPCSPFWDVIIKNNCIIFLYIDVSELKTDLIYLVKINKDLN